ncbi:MAG: hypothetical protein QMC66_10900 [Ascidiaceihabitans sp.]|mgnify:FL=1|jgi:hypothetical protein|tara:strand:+ start:1211 stop:1660 length:450 start_codon:yes stop_codon:yes gene_type:complete
MKPDEISSSLLENDSFRVLAGCIEVRNSNGRTILRAGAARVLPKRAQVEDIELDGGIIPNKHWLQLALTKLALSKGDTCFCAMYPHSEFYDPEKEQDSHNVSTELKERNLKTWSTKHISHCKSCGQCLEVHGEGGWHVPWWKWSELDVP